MKTKMTVLIAISMVALFLAATASACGSGEDSGPEIIEWERVRPRPPRPRPAAPAMQIREVVKEVQVPGETVVVEKEVVKGGRGALLPHPPRPRLRCRKS